MKPNDRRKLGPEQQEEIRRRAISAIHQGHPPSEVARTMQVSEPSVFEWIARYRNGGWGALTTERRSGRPKKANAEMMRHIYNRVTDADPRQLGFDFALWTLQMVRTLIRDEFDVLLSKSSASRLLRQMGPSAQRPVWRAWQQDPDAARCWQSRQIPALRAPARARRIGAKVYFADEAATRSDSHSGTTWGERGRTPVVKATGARFSCSMISAVSPRGDMRFMVTERRMDAGLLCEFLDRLMHDEPGHVLLVVDGHPSHKAKKVREHLAKFGGRLHLCYLPGYCPELDPAELVWNWVKNQKLGREAEICDKQGLMAGARPALASLQKQTDKMRGLFPPPRSRIHQIRMLLQ